MAQITTLVEMNTKEPKLDRVVHLMQLEGVDDSNECSPAGSQPHKPTPTSADHQLDCAPAQPECNATCTNREQSQIGLSEQLSELASRDMSAKVNKVSSEPAWRLDSTIGTGPSLHHWPLKGMSNGEKAFRSPSASPSSTASEHADLKEDYDWMVNSHLAAPIIFSVHSVHNLHTGSPAFPSSLPISRDDDARRHLSWLAEHANSLKSASQKEQDRARMAWVIDWLRTNYLFQAREDHIVSRQAMYYSFAQDCELFNIKCQNSASFGKSVRAAFQGIKTRRLGPRGESRYHYVGLSPRLQSECHRLSLYDRRSSFDDRLARRGVEHLQRLDESDDEQSEEGDMPDGHSARLWRTTSSISLNSSSASNEDRDGLSSTSDNASSYMLRHSSSSDVRLSETLDNFWSSFMSHMEQLKLDFENYSLDRFEMTMRTFWPSMHPLRDILQTPSVSVQILQALSATYSEMISAITPDAFGPRPGKSVSALRKFAKCLETIGRVSLALYNSSFAEPQIELAARTGHLIIRVCDLQQLSVALLTIIADAKQVDALLRAWDAIDMETISDQTALTCNCHIDTLDNVLADFRETLAGASNETDNVISGGEVLLELADCLQRVVNTTVSASDLSPRGLLIRVAFITSQMTRDLTLRSDAAVGPFQFLKTWVDDLSGLIILQMVALRDTSIHFPKVDDVGREPVSEVGPSAPMRIVTGHSSSWQMKQELGAEMSLTPRAGPTPAVRALGLLQLG